MSGISIQICKKLSLTRCQLGLICLGVLIYLFIASLRSACGNYKYIPANEIVLDLVATSIANTNGNANRVCPPIPVFHSTKVPIITDIVDLSLALSKYNLQSGGAWRPEKCLSQHSVAIIVPYRNRETQLRIFLHHMHPFLQQQMLDYRIIIVEQVANSRFNRAALFNVGFAEAQKLGEFHCFIFHDVDLLPEDRRNIYGCSHQPRHMSSSVNIFRYNLPYKSLFGGAVAMTPEQFKEVNGYSNLFFGWGGEDDDMSNRIRHHGMEIIRWDPDVAKYHMITHVKESASNDRYGLLKKWEQRNEEDGLNSLNYHKNQMASLEFYSWYLVAFPQENARTS